MKTEHTPPNTPAPLAQTAKPGANLTANKPHTHTISLYVQNKPGVLVRIALVFARRAYNIESLVVGPAILNEFSRVTITCSGETNILEQILKQLSKLVDVVHATDHTDDEHYETEIALIKLNCPLNQRSEVLPIIEEFKGKVVDYGPTSLMIRAYGHSQKLDNLIAILSNYQMIELVRSGKILMARGGNPT